MLPGWGGGGNSTHGPAHVRTSTLTLTQMCMPSGCRGQPGTEASLRPPSQRPPPPTACLPAATFVQLCLVFSCLPSLLGAGARGGVRGALSTACTWASARDKPAEHPPRCPPTGKGRAGPRLSKSPGGAGTGVGGDRGTHSLRPRQEQSRPREAALPLGEDRQSWTLCQNSLGPAKAMAGVPQDVGGHPPHPNIEAMHMRHTCAQTPKRGHRT